jgi:hypothetical protein
MATPTGFIIYRGPSLLDGAPIVVIAVTASSNRKTGNMVQTYILRADCHPVEAIKTGADASICGDCKHRPALGGACYVVVPQGPASVYRAFVAGKYPTAPNLPALGAGRMVRLGTYGDPGAVPVEVWESLTARADGRTGYTHQWRNPSLAADHRARLLRLCMASVDSPAEARAATAAGYRYFRIRAAGEPIQPLEFTCPASEEAGKRLTCTNCGACDGTRRQSADGRALGGSPVIIVHGSKARRFQPAE